MSNMLERFHSLHGDGCHKNVKLKAFVPFTGMCTWYNKHTWKTQRINAAAMTTEYQVTLRCEACGEVQVVTHTREEMDFWKMFDND